MYWMGSSSIAVKVDLRKLKTDGKAFQQLLRGLKSTFPDKMKMAAAYIDKGKMKDQSRTRMHGY